MKPELTVVIPTYNNPEGAKELVRDFYHLHNPDMFRIISIDQTEEGITFDADTPVHLHIKAYRNLGFSKAMNTGWKLSTTPFTLIANDDVRLLHPSWYETAKACVLKDGVLAVNPFPATRTWDGGGNPTWYWDQQKDGKRDERFDFIKDKKFEEYTDEDYQKLKGLLTSGDGPGATMFFTLMRTEARDIVGYFDEGYWNGGEDYDFNRRCFLKGYKINTCTHSLVHHQCGVTKQNAVAAKEANGYELVAKNKNIFNTKWSTPDCPNPDIYGRTGNARPNTPWTSEIDL